MNKITVCGFALAVLTGGLPIRAQAPAVLEVDVENIVSYSSDVFDAPKFATDPNLTTVAAGGRNFGFVMAVGDIIAVNGKPAKGALVVRQQAVVLSPTPTPGQGVADISRTAVSDYLLEIQEADGNLVGNIHTLGLSGGVAAVGAPTGSGGNLVVAGGTGAFVGARGQMATRLLPGGPGPRTASVTEDPSRRRNYPGGGRVQFVVQLFPMTRPEIVNVWHSDFSPVTAAKPVRADENLILAVRGLGPTRPGFDPGVPFPANPPQIVNSPIEITAGGQPVEPLVQIGWPGEQNLYRVDFRMPKTSGSTAALQLTAAWIGAPPFTIPVQ